jgi:hypothetical protein
MKKRSRRCTDPDVLARTLTHIPIIHTQADMGALNESISQLTLRKAGRAALKRKTNLIGRTWTKIEQAIEDLHPLYERVRLYQDGLPVCDRETEIVTELANTGSRNHQLLLRLMERGAILMGTESAELLQEEYELIKEILSGGDASEAAKIESRQKALSDSLLRRRDQYIANRINSTLRPAETGILFLGMLHTLTRLLDDDIRIIYPVIPPLDHGDKKG